ncbi:MAG: PDZ domain-containing protein [Anaerolineae bacterium]|nr:PDZ domain-containing protein [Anaerolineae bacterium]
MSSKLKKWYVILGLTLAGLAVCMILLVAGGLAGGAVAYMASQGREPFGLQGPWHQINPQIPEAEEAPNLNPQQPWQMPPQRMLGPSSGQLWGAVVMTVVADGPAEQAGMETGDIIIAVDNKAMDQDQDLRALIGNYKPEDEIIVTIVRPGDDPELTNLEVTLDSATNEEGDEVAHLGVEYRTVSSGLGMMSLERMPWSGEGSQTY